MIHQLEAENCWDRYKDSIVEWFEITDIDAARQIFVIAWMHGYSAHQDVMLNHYKSSVPEKTKET